MKTLNLILIAGLIMLLAAYQRNCYADATSPVMPSLPESFHVKMTPAEIALSNQQYNLEQNAQEALNIGNYSGAIDFADKAAALPTLSDGRGEGVRAEALFLSGQDDLACQAYEQIVEQENGLHGHYLLPYALLKLKAGDWSKAAAAYNKLYYPNQNQTNQATGEQSPFDPANPGSIQDLETAIYTGLGSFYGAGTMWLTEPTLRQRQASVEFKNALALEPHSPLALRSYAHWLLDNKRLPEAKAIFENLSATAQGHIKADADDVLKTRLANVPYTQSPAGSGQN